MACCFTKVSEEEIIVAINEAVFFYSFDLVNTKTTIPLKVGEGRWIYTSTLRVSVYIHHYSPPFRGIVVYHLCFFLLLGAVSCYCCERYSVRIPKIQKKLITPKDGQEEALVALTQTETLGDWRISAASETNC